jgi:ATP-dependent 26S proteasome regulatory subunit
LVDRPGRIDLRIELGLPESELREHIFKKYLKEMKTEKMNYKLIVKKSEGLSGAYIREVVMSAYLDAKEMNEKITQKRLEESLELVVKMKQGVDSSISMQDHYHL